MSGSILLSDIAQRTTVLLVGCDQCSRVGRYSLETLMERHGASFSIPMLLRTLSADCPKRQSQSAYDLCGIHCPELSKLFMVPERKPPSPVWINRHLEEMS